MRNLWTTQRDCRDLLGADISTEGSYKRARDGKLLKTTCVNIVRSAVEILERLGY